MQVPAGDQWVPSTPNCFPKQGPFNPKHLSGEGPFDPEYASVWGDSLVAASSLSAQTVQPAALMAPTRSCELPEREGFEPANEIFISEYIVVDGPVNPRFIRTQMP